MSAKRNRALVWAAVMAVDLAMAGSACADAAWYSVVFAYRAKLTIQHTNVTADLTNFPVLVRLTNATLKDTANGGHVGQSDAGDILFTKDDGTTRLNHEIESYTGANGDLIAWVSVDALSAATDTELYMYYGNADIANQGNVAGTWDAHYLMVQHLQGTNSTALDATINARNGYLTSGATPHVPGQMDGAVDLDGTAGNCVSTPDINVINNTNHTISLWFRSGDTADYGALAGKLDYEFVLGANYYGSGKIDYTAWNSVGNPQISLVTPVVANDTNWHQVAYTADYGTPEFRIYVDGALAASTNIFSGTQRNTSYGISFGSGYQAGAFLGNIDEIGVSDLARSADWIKTSYNNQKTPATFFSLGAEQAVSNQVAPWYANIWLYRTKLVVLRGDVAGPLTNFPILVSGTRTNWKDTANGGHMGKSDAGDILFTKADGVTKLNHEIESYTGSDGTLVAWVAANALSATADTEIYMYYGNAAASNQWSAGETWDAHYLMVHHLQGTNATALDATTNARNGTLTGGYTAHVPGQANGAADLDGSGYLSTVDINAINNANHTIGMWYRRSAVGASGVLAGKGTLSANYEFILVIAGSAISYAAWQSSGSDHISFGTPPLANDTNWHHVAYTADYGAPDFRIYVDGALATNTATYAGTEINRGHPVQIGYGYNWGYFSGDVDEIDVSDVARSADWIKTSYNNQKNPASSIGFCREERMIPKGTLIIIR